MKLKPCPFCGGEAHVWKHGARYGAICYVKCDICGAQTGVKSCKEEVNSDAWEDVGISIVEKNWNVRVSEREVTNE